MMDAEEEKERLRSIANPQEYIEELLLWRRLAIHYMSSQAVADTTRKFYELRTLKRKGE